MTIVTTMPVSGDWTVDDLDHLPDDGLRYELVDGASREMATARADEALTIERPFPMTAVLSQLVR